ncbi:MAG: hypothetical protein O3A53_08185 [Acidobacteria bacterium]|nr:hypothetical protein [Acidobacteriota bacterium]MDA1234765.1 hypothetical protein [Acidobacteriota bacterium]
MTTIAKVMAGFALLLSPVAHPVSAQAPEEKNAPVTVRDGIFTIAQAERGATVFAGACKGCHQPEQFIGAGFIDAWSGQTADAPFEVIRTKMPEDNPSSLKRSEYAAVLAYLFRLNGLPAGDTDLPNLLRKLKLIRIEVVPETEERP